MERMERILEIYKELGLLDEEKKEYLSRLRNLVTETTGTKEIEEQIFIRISSTSNFKEEQ